MNFKNFFLLFSLFILFLSFSSSFAHNQTHVAPPGPPQNSSSSNESTDNSNSSTNSSSYKGCFSKVYAFGDSFTDTGNAAALKGLKSFVTALLSHSPYGSTTQLPGQRLSNGRLVIDFLCDSLGLPPLAAYKDSSGNFSSGVNFAVAGSTSLSGNNFATNKIGHTLMWNSIPQIFQTQIDWFHKFLSSSGWNGKSASEYKAEMENALFWIGALGGNDYARIFGSTISVKWLTEMSVGQVYKILKILLDRGAKYLVVQGLPPVGCTPLDLSLCPTKDRDSMGCAPVTNAMIMAHNELLKKKVIELQKQYSHCIISFADTWNAYRHILTNYKKYQFEEPFKACCGSGGGLFNFDLHRLCGSIGTSTCKNPQQHINWDGVHLTEAMHKHLADLFFNESYCYPPFNKLIQAKKGIKSLMDVVN